MGDQGLTVATSVGAVERFAAMGTRVELHAFDAKRDLADLFAVARQAVEAVDDALTIHRPSPVTAVNEALMAGETAAIDDPLLFKALVLVDDAHAATFELFDVSTDARRGGGWHLVTLDRAARRIRAARPLALDFGGMGKGFALDCAAAVLRAGGMASALLSAGESSILVIGEHPLGGGWPFAIPHPLQDGEPLVEVELNDEALSISSNVGAGTLAPERAATIRPHDACAAAQPRCTVAVAASGAAAEMTSTALMAADRAQARRLLCAAPAACFCFQLGAAPSARPTRIYA